MSISPGRARSSFTLATAVVAGVLALTGCSGEEKTASAVPAASPTRHAASPPAADRAGHVERATVSRAPEPVDDGKVLLSVEPRKGSAELPLTREIGVGSLDIQVDCQGKGTLEVDLKPVEFSFSLECVDGKVRGTSNEIRLKSARGRGSVQITTPSTVTWALTVQQ
ncbi:hypothetical protein ACWD7Y_00030 [Streptomyces drozdowiczii]